MKSTDWTSVVLAVGLALTGQCLLAQDGMAGAGGGRQRGGFGGGQSVVGTVTAATKDSVTLKTDAGDVYTVTASDTARIVRDRQPIKLADVKPGDSVTAMGAVDAAKKTVQAMMINDIDAATVQKAKDDLGKTYITGKVTAIDLDNAKVTVLRADGVSQSITLDDGTSIQKGARGIQVGLQAEMGGRGGMGGGRPGGNGAAAAPAAPESITLADVKAGDSIVASGALKAGVFVPVKMGVVEAGAGGGRRRGAAPAADGSAPAGGPPPSPPPSPPPAAPPQ